LNYGDIIVINSYSTGDVDGTTYVGGFIGFNGIDYGYVAINNSYSTSDVNGSTTHIGGLIGRSDAVYSGARSRIENSYATGNVVSTTSGSPTGVGGLVGYFYAYQTNTENVILNSYSTGEVSSNSAEGGGIVGELLLLKIH